jgi:NAD(P)-dependent dehydrogenase (short-subunit alcohol dehydrogenase family)
VAAASVVITGASTGIGREAALYLDTRGVRVFAGVRRSQDADALRAAASQRLTPVTLDVTDAAGIDAAAKSVEQALEGAGLGGIVNNAGIGVAAPLEFIDLDELRRQLEINVVGPVAVTRAFLPLLRPAKGRVVHVGSMAGYNAGPFLGPYAASKHAIEALTDSLRRELRPWGLHVSLIEPGSIETPIWGKAWSDAAEVRGALSEQASELYGDSLDHMVEYMRRVSARAIPAERVARAIHHALTAERPRTRYRVGLDAKLVRVLTRVLPDRVADALMARMIGFPEPS